MSKTPTVEAGVTSRGGRVGVLLRAPYSDRLITDIKREIPSNEREYSPASEGWWVARRYQQRAIRIALRYNASVLVLGEGGAPDQLVDRSGRRAEQGRLPL